MTTFKTVEQITNKFIKDGWGKNTSFEELSLEEGLWLRIIVRYDVSILK